MKVLRVGVAPWSYLHPECYKSPKADCNAGVELDILDMVASMAGLSLELVVSKESGCGKTPLESKDGNWTGLFKMVLDKQVDLTGNLCDINKLAQFQNAISTSFPVWQYHEQFAIKTPTPTPLSFDPFAPFKRNVWALYAAAFLMYIILVMSYSYIRFSSMTHLFARVFKAVFELTDVCCGFVKHVPLKLFFPLWLLILTSAFIFYNTYILSAVMHPFPIYAPFTSIDELAVSLMSGDYRLVSYKSPPTFPGGCLGIKCGDDFSKAIDKNGFLYIANAQGKDQLMAIDQQDPSERSKLVLVQGEPFMSLYLSEYLEGRGNMWLIEAGGTYDKWSGFVWRKDFEYAVLFNKYLEIIGDYKVHAMSRYIRPFGAQPHTGNQISEQVIQQKRIAINRFVGLFYMFAAGVGGSLLVFAVERWCPRKLTDWLFIV